MIVLFLSFAWHMNTSSSASPKLQALTLIFRDLVFVFLFLCLVWVARIIDSRSQIMRKSWIFLSLYWGWLSEKELLFTVVHYWLWAFRNAIFSVAFWQSTCYRQARTIDIYRLDKILVLRYHSLYLRTHVCLRLYHIIVFFDYLLEPISFIFIIIHNSLQNF